MVDGTETIVRPVGRGEKGGYDGGGGVGGDDQVLQLLDSVSPFAAWLLRSGSVEVLADALSPLCDGDPKSNPHGLGKVEAVRAANTVKRPRERRRRFTFAPAEAQVAPRRTHTGAQLVVRVGARASAGTSLYVRPRYMMVGPYQKHLEISSGLSRWSRLACRSIAEWAY